MTNGEKLVQIFPNLQITDLNSRMWWNTEYEEPTTKNDLGVDCISRAKAIEAMQDKAKKLTNEDTINGLCGAVAILFDLPSVTPIRPRKGEWCKQNDDYFNWYECSECGYGSEGEMQYSSEYDVRTNYCPNCGADMREVVEE